MPTNSIAHSIWTKNQIMGINTFIDSNDVTVTTGSTRMGDEYVTSFFVTFDGNEGDNVTIWFYHPDEPEFRHRYDFMLMKNHNGSFVKMEITASNDEDGAYDIYHLYELNGQLIHRHMRRADVKVMRREGINV